VSPATAACQSSTIVALAKFDKTGWSGSGDSRKRAEMFGP
jgi:hypothetical protein